MVQVSRLALAAYLSFCLMFLFELLDTFLIFFALPFGTDITTRPNHPKTFVTATRTEDDELNGDGGRNGERQHPRRPRQDLGRGGEDTSSPSARETPAQEGGEDVRVEPNGFDDVRTTAPRFWLARLMF